jgi:histidyl-tRNA synthetase
MKQAAGLGVSQVLLLGDDEVRADSVTVRSMASSSQVTVPAAELLRVLTGDVH